MTSSPPNRPGALPFRVLFLSLLACSVLVGCGLKRPPKPPEEPAPPKPKKVRAFVREGRVHIAWAAPAVLGEKELEPESWEILRSEQDELADPPVYRIAGVSQGNTFYDDGLPPGGKAVYAIRAVSSDGTKGKMSAPILVDNIEPPPAPSDFVAKPRNGFVTLAWKEAEPAPAAAIEEATHDLVGGDTAEDIVGGGTAEEAAAPKRGYNLYRSADGEVFPARPVNAEPITGASYDDGPLTNGATYYYQLRPVVVPPGGAPAEGPPAGPGLVSAVPRDVTAPSRPRGLTGVSTEDGVLLRWLQNPESDLAGYIVYRRNRGRGHYRPLFDAPIAETGYTDKTAGTGGDYDYVIRAFDNADPPNQSEPSQRHTVYVIPEE